jgi:DNA-binding GntR family transcriptional regulator
MPITQSRLVRPLARDEAYEKLKHWIIDGTLRPGEALRDQQIAGSLGVSRTPVREALRRLEDEGFVETALNRWTRVAPLDLKKAIETYGVIKALEVVALDAAQLTAEDLEKMKRANDDMRRALRLKQAASALEADEAFHNVWLARAQNDELYVLVQQLKTRLRRVELAYWKRAPRTGQSVGEHEELLKALQKGSKRLAILALKRNWDGAKERVQTLTIIEAEQRRDLSDIQ